MESINLNNISLTDSGTVRFSGLSSGIDFQSAIDAIIQARRIQAVQIEDKITLNNEKVNYFALMKDLSADFASSLDVLRGSDSFFSTDVFDSKLGFATSQPTATAPGGHKPSPAVEILGVTVGADALVGTHTVEVVNIAKAHQLRSGAFSDKTADLSGLGFTMGDFTINGKTVSLTAGDTLLDLRDKINAVNTGGTPSNVGATVISVSATEHYLVLTSTETGTSNNINFGGTLAVHNDLGLTDLGTTTITNELQVAENATIRVDNLGVDIVRESNVISDVIQGVTLDIFKAEADTEIVIDIEPDLNAIKSAIGDFMTAYNELKAFILDQRAEIIRTEGGEPEFGKLAFDSTLRLIDSKMGELVTLNVDGVETGYSSLGQVGITVDNNFLLTIDDATFDEKLLTDVDALRKLFSFDASASDSRVTVIGHTVDTTYTVDGFNNPEPYYLNIAGTDINGDIISANIQTAAAAGAGGADDGSITVAGGVATATNGTGADGLKILFNGGVSALGVDDIQITYTRGIADR